MIVVVIIVSTWVEIDLKLLGYYWEKFSDDISVCGDFVVCSVYRVLNMWQE